MSTNARKFLKQVHKQIAATDKENPEQKAQYLRANCQNIK